MIIYGAVDGGLGWSIKDLKGPKLYTFRKVLPTTPLMESQR